MQNRIQELREEHNMTQVRLSIELGVSQETISAYEKGKHYPSVAMLLKLSTLYHASCDYILGLSSVRYSEDKLNIDPQSQKVLTLYQSLSPHKKELLQAYLSGLTSE